jgi:TP901 family phage tail tape measure protein
MSSNSYTRRINLFINGKEVTADIASIKNEMRKLVNEQARMTIGSREYNQHMQKIKGLKGIIQEHNDQLKVTKSSWSSLSSMADKFNKYFGMATAFIATATGVVFGAKKIIESNAELSDSFADVSKTTGLTSAEVQELYKELKKIDTRTANKGLLELATIAGKLGVTGKENVLGFVRSADQINVALSEDLGGNAEEAIKQVGKLVDIFKIKDTFGLEKGMLKVGSAINALGAASTASEGYLVEFAKRVAGIAPSAGISIEKVLGLAATLDQLGQTSEVSSTVYAQIIPLMFKDTATFADIANMSVDDFRKLLDKDVNEAFIKFLEGLNGNNEGLATMTLKLDELGLEGKRSTAVLGVLANNTELLREQQTLANDEFRKGSSLTDEFEKKNTNLAATIDKLRKRFANMFVSSGIVNGLKGFVTWIDKITSTSIVNKLREEQQGFNSIMMTLQGTNKNTEQRVRLVAEIQSKYADYIKNIDLENASYDELEKLLKDVNSQFEKRIRLAVVEEELKENQIEAVKLDRERYNLQKNIDEQAIKHLGKQASEMTNEEKIAALIKVKKQLNKDILEQGMQNLNITSVEVTSLHIAAKSKQKLIKINERLNELQKEYSTLLAEQENTRIPNEEEIKPTNDDEDDIDKGTSSFKSSKLIEARKKLDEQLKQLRDEDRLRKMTENERELEQIRLKYEKDLEEFKTGLENKEITKAEFDAHEIEINGFRDSEIAIKKEEQKKKDEEDEAAHQAALFAIKEEYGLLTEQEIIDAEIAAIKAKQEWEKLSEADKEKILKAIREKGLKDIEETEEKKKEIVVNTTADMLSNAAGLFKKHTLAYKALASAETLINTYKAAQAAYSAVVGIVPVGPILAPIAAGVAIAAGLKNVAEINKVKQAARGKYNVVGADDGRFYPNVPFVGPVMNSGIVHGATLISENADEMILNGPHVRNLQANYPEILRAIYATRVPQRAEGSYGTKISNQSMATNDLLAPINTLNKLLGQMLTKGIIANAIIDQRKVYELRKEISNQVNIETEAAK